MKLAEYLEKNKITQAALAKMLDVSVVHAHTLIREKQFPSRRIAIKIDEITGGLVSKEELLFPK